MGDLLFILKMTVYTVIIVIIMQVKIGSTTIEQKAIELTHNSQIAGVLQSVAQGAVTFVGVQYNRATGHLKSGFFDKHKSSNQPGSRLQEKMLEIKKSVNEKWEQYEKKSEDIITE